MPGDREEMAILESIERGEWRSVPKAGKERKKYRDYAQAALRKNKRINIRISDEDLGLASSTA